MIQVDQLSKFFSSDKGIFDLNFQVKPGEVFGYIGPNGAGKSTTIRHLMGFMKPDNGKTSILGLDCWDQAAEVKQHVGYLPGEISFIEGMTGLQFLQLMSELRKQKDVKYRNNLIDRFQFDVKTPIRKMSKGMKQKTGIVAAFMHNPQVLILDEPTSGLDPLMQRTFIELVLEEKQKGKTILISSHSFQEMERTCDRAGIIKNGRLIAIEDIQKLRTMKRKIFEVKVKDQEDVNQIIYSGLEIERIEGMTVWIAVKGNDNEFIRQLSHCNVLHLDSHIQDLEDVFMHYYENRGKDNESITL